jgi:cytochrome bd-type quinol oxidase subunit 2
MTILIQACAVLALLIAAVWVGSSGQTGEGKGFVAALLVCALQIVILAVSVLPSVLQ